MFDITGVEKEAQDELNKEMAGAAKTKIKASLRTIAMAERALANARADHQILLRDIGSDVQAA